MVMKLLAGIAVAAGTALLAYQRASTSDPAGTAEKVKAMRQVLSVVMEIVAAIQAVLDALQFVRNGTWRRPGSGGFTGGFGRSGMTVAEAMSQGA